MWNRPSNIRPTIYRGELFYFTSASSWEYIEDGALGVADGRIQAVGDFTTLRAAYPEAPLVDYRGFLLMPGFIDAHLHYVQSEIIGLYGKQLLDWLQLYTFPAEEAFRDAGHARRIARLFLQELFRNGTTACVAFASIHPQSVEALFDEASRYDMCLITGKVQMDRQAPPALCESVGESERQVLSLLPRWHGKGRLRYAVTPRFALSCSPQMMRLCAELLQAFPTTYLQTHLSENKDEIRQILSLFLDKKDYLQVYEDFGLLTDRSLLAHGVHLSSAERRRIATAGAAVVHCPTSNAFLGSGLYSLKEANLAQVETLLGTDVGAGTSFSMFRTMGAAYGIQQLGGYSLSAFESFYRATLGAARSLRLDGEMGTFLPGRYADFIVVDYLSTLPQQLRAEYLSRTNQWDITQKLFGLQVMADDRSLRATYVSGKRVFPA